MGIWRQLAEYLYIKKKDTDRPANFNTRLMHGMNRISLLIFLMCLLIIFFKYVLLPLIRK
ncbi:hypothetical protein HNQ91_000262 [Filimonas zeae]|uniref:DUF6728 family protein n=1 Tax=Filimonas zeae TaxID=1737353 RepID=UPI0027E52F9C|nr:DUF6728 family protein [Filimonas zeae]MDR6337240.1 hypothetical protein [Filimonas zeae]